MKLFKLITFFALFLLCNALKAQTFIYSYTDPCTGLIKSMNVPSNGVTVTYFGQIQTFDPQDFQTGVFDTWAEGVYNSFGGANPCGSIFGVSTSIDIAQSTAINFISIINNISALADLQSAISGGGSLNTMSAIESAKNSSDKKDKKDKKKNQTTTTDNSSQNTTTNQSTSNNESNTEGSQNQNSNQSNQSGTTNTGSDQNVQSGQTNGSTNTENGQNTTSGNGQNTTSGNGQNQSGGENSPTNSNQNTTSQNSQSGTENNQTNSNSQNGNSSQNGDQNTGGSTTTGENSQSTEGGPVNSTGQLNQTLTQSTDIGSGSGSGSNQNQTTQNSQTTTNGENSTTTTEQPNTQSGTNQSNTQSGTNQSNTQSGTNQSNTQSGTENSQSTNTTTENNSQNSGEPNSETGQNGQTTTSENSQNKPQNENGQTGETSSTNSEAGQTPNGENPQTTQNDPSQNGQSSNSSNSSNGNGENGVGGNSNDNAAQNSEDKKTNFLGGTVKSVERSTESNKPQIVLSSDFAGFNFRSGEVDFGGKGTAGYTSLSWDGRRTYGVLLDYTSIIRGPNVTGFFANIAKKRIDLISLTGTFSFYGRGSQYGSLAIGQMWNLNKKKSLKAIYMATASFGNVYGEQFLGTAFIGGGMYDWRVHKRVDIKLMNLFIYAPYVSYYNDILLKSPYVIMPIVGTNIGITKKFKFNLNFGGAYAINENVMNFTLMFGTRFAL